MSDNNNITSSYIREKSNIVPEWVKKLDTYKDKIINDIHTSGCSTDSGVKFLHPIDVPNPPKR